MDEIIIWRAAEIMIGKRGIYAEEIARDQQLNALANHDTEGSAIWGQILAAIGKLRQRGRDGEPAQ